MLYYLILLWEIFLTGIVSCPYTYLSSTDLPFNSVAEFLRNKDFAGIVNKSDLETPTNFVEQALSFLSSLCTLLLKKQHPQVETCPRNVRFRQSCDIAWSRRRLQRKVRPLNPPLKPLRKPSTSLSNLLDNTSEYTPSQNTTGSLFVPHHRYNHRDLPSRRLSTDTSTLNLSALSSISTLRLLRQHAQPLSSETNSSDFEPSPYFTSGFDTASLLSSDAQTAFLSGNLFSEVIIPTPVPAHIRIPEYYTADQSRPPTPNFADYPLRVDGITIYDPQHDPRFPIFAERFITNNNLLSHKRKETALKRLQRPNLELKFEVKVKFQGLNPHPIFHVSKIEHKTSPAPFEVIHIDFERDLNIPTITNGKIIFCNRYSGLKYTTSF